MKCEDIRQAWREKINFIIWFICACAVFVIIFLGLPVICPTEYVFKLQHVTGTGVVFIYD